MESALTAFLAPFLPYLLKAGGMAADKAADGLAGEAGRWAEALWVKLLPSVGARPAAGEAASDVAANPNDRLARSALELQFHKILADNAQLRQEVARRLEDATRAGIVGNVVVGGDVAADHGSIGVIGTVGGDLRVSDGREDA